MKACEKINDKLIFFNDLNEKEKQQMQRHLDECEGCRKKMYDFQNIMSSIKVNQERHPIKDDLLIRYSVHLAAPGETDYNGKKLARSEIETIEKHTLACELCKKKIERFQREYQEIEDYLDETDLPALNLGPQPALARISDSLEQLFKSIIQGIKDLTNIPLPKLYPVVVGAVAALFITVWVGPFFRGNENPYLQLLSVDTEKASFLTRSSLSQTLSEGLVAFNQGDQERAIQSLESFITNGQSAPSLFYAHYVLGIAYLDQAKSDFLGRFPKINSELVEAGIQNLAIAKGLTQNSSITEGCDWYIGTALLMKGDENGAKKIFEAIIDLRGRRLKDAKEMVAEIDRLMQSQ